MMGRFVTVSKQLILSNFIDPISDTECHFRKNTLLYIKDGVVVGTYDADKMSDFDLSQVEFLDHSDQIVLPAFYDMHFHWVQDDVRMMPKENLLKWLEDYTWPYEQKFEDVNYSLERAKKFSKELISVGTLGGACYSSIHSHTVDHALDFFKGDFIVGNVLMTMNSPEYLLQSEKEAIESVELLSAKYKERYALTPRFAITTSPGVMSKTAKIAKENSSFIQTHLSETENEIDFVLSIYKEIEEFKDVPDYTEIYDRCSHLGAKTLMGHGIYLSDKELKSLAGSDTVIAHCPTSNGPIDEGGLGSGLFDFEKVEDYGIRWALGSDIGAGPYLSMFDVIRSFVDQNKKKGQDKATYIKGLFRATRAGEKILHPESQDSYLTKGSVPRMIFLNTPISKDQDVENLLGRIVTSCTREEYQKIVDKVWFEREFL